jgi:uncharacterized protein (DUF342 family)
MVRNLREEECAVPAEPSKRDIRVVINEDKLEARALLGASLEPDQLDEPTLCALAGEAGVLVDPAVRELIKVAVATVARTPGVEHQLVIARGEAPVHGTHGRITFAPEYLPSARHAEAARTEPTGEHASAQRPDESINHYARSAFTPVLKGTIIARVEPSVEGIDGRDVTGKSLACKRATEAPLKHDQSVSVGPDGSVVAQQNGILSWRPPLLRIIDTLEVDGFVDFSTGHIDFPGSVLVHRGVRDLFKVHADRSLAVRGLVEAAELSAALDTSLTGGMAAKRSGSLQTGRDLRANYLNNVRVRAGRDASIESELINCDIVAGRAIVAPRCVMAGGSACAGSLIDLRTVGSESRTATHLRLGTLTELAALRTALRSLLPDVQARYTAAADQLQQLKSVKGKLSPRQAESLTELEFESASAAKTLDRLNSAGTHLDNVIARRIRVELIVRDRIFSGVTLRCPGAPADALWVVQFTTDLKGPIRITADDHGRLVVRESLGDDAQCIDLAKVAKVGTEAEPATGVGTPASMPAGSTASRKAA